MAKATRIRANEASGSSVATTKRSPGLLAKSNICLSLQLFRGIDVHGQVVVVEVQHDRQGDGRLRRRHDDDEQGEHLALDRERRVEVGEGDEVDRGSVE